MAFVPDEAVFDSHSISHSAFKLYVCYCAHRNSKSGLAWPDRETISQVTGIFGSYISTLKKELEKAGWLVLEGKKIRPIKGFQNPAENSNNPTPENESKEVKPELPKKEATISKMSNGSTFCPSENSNDSNEMSNGSTKMSNDSNEMSNGSNLHIKEHEPVEEPVEEPIEEPIMLSAPPKVKKPRPPDLLFESLAEVCQIDWRMCSEKQRGEMNQTTGILRKLNKSPAEVRYFGAWWYSNFWKGQKGQAPTPTEVREIWPQAFSNYKPQERESENERRLREITERWGREDEENRANHYQEQNGLRLIGASK